MSSKYPSATFGVYTAAPPYEYRPWSGETGNKPPEFGFYAGGRIGPPSTNTGDLVESPEALAAEAKAYAAEQAQRAAILAKYKALDDEWKSKHPLGLAEEYRLARKRHEDARGVKTRVRNSDQRAVSL